MPGEQAGRLVAVADAELAAGPVAIGVDGGLRHPQFARDLLGRKVLVDEAQAFALSRRQELDLRILRHINLAHSEN
ncbi:MAG: hypothetical protein WDA06_13610, partial [Phenylobacterium sp.]